MLSCLAVIVGNLSKLRRSDVIVIYYEGGFGHLIHGPDTARRLFLGKRTTVLFFYQKSRHNPYAFQIWPDIDVIPVMINPFANLGFPVSSATRIGTLAAFALTRMLPKADVLKQEELLRRLAPADLADDGVTINLWVPGHYRLMRSAPVAPLRLPEALRAEAARRMGALPGSYSKLCRLYLRDKGGSFTTACRSGGDIEDYLPAIRHLNAHGYRVGLTGDRTLDAATARDFGPGLVDAESVGLETALFDIYMATECDIQIAEPGGGAYIPVVNHRPTLMINTFPYFAALPNTVHYYKVVRDAAGRVYPAAELFRRFYIVDDSSLTDGDTLPTNEPAEILAAVRSFLDTGGQGMFPDFAEPLPANYWMRFTTPGVSPAWIERYVGPDDHPPRQVV